MRIALGAGQAVEMARTFGWPEVTAALSLALPVGFVGERLSSLLTDLKIDLASLANGMELNPMTFADGWRVMWEIPDNWWVVMCVSLIGAMLFLRTRYFQVDHPWRSLVFYILAVFLVRAILEGHIPLGKPDFETFGPAHFAVHKVFFLIENAIMCGFAWIGAWGGWKIMEMK